MAGAFGRGTLAASSLVIGAAAALRFRIGLRTIGLSGRAGGEMAGLVDLHVNVPGASGIWATACPATTFTICLRIVRATFGSPLSMGSTVFTSFPWSRIPGSKVCRIFPGEAC